MTARPSLLLASSCVLASCLFITRPLGAQAITLPTIRATGPTGAEELLLRRIEAAKTLYAGSDTGSRRRRNDLTKAIDRLRLAGVTSDELRKVKDAQTAEDTARLLFPRGARDDRNAKAALAAFIAVRPDSARASELPEVSEFETGDLLASLRRDETDQIRRAALDTISMAARAVVIERKLRTRKFFPVRSREQASTFWRQPEFSVLGVGVVGGSASGGIAFTELGSPILHALRVSINAVVAASEEKEDTAGGDAAAEPTEQSDATLSRFVNGGGLVNLGFALPAAIISVPEGQFSAMVLLAPRVGATLPIVGGTNRDTTIMYDAGLELHLRSVDASDGVGLIAQLRSAWAVGSSSFGELLGVKDGKDSFGYSTVSFGFLFGGRYMVTASRSVLGPASFRDRGWQVGFTAMAGSAQ